MINKLKSFDDLRTALIVASIILALLTVIFGITYTASYFEAQAFESATGKHVSTWDAMFIELRVQEDAKQ